MSDKLTALEAIKKAIKLTYQQGERSVDSDGNCLYRGERGLKCAVGHLIADEHYNPSLEGNNVTRECVLNALGKSGVSVVCLESVLSDIQQAHDNSYEDFKNSFVGMLYFVANRQGLVEQALKELESEGVFNS